MQVRGQNPNGQNPNGQNPNGQNHNHWFILIYTCMHGSVPWFMYTYIHTYYHHAELLDAPYTIMLFWFILLLTESQILTKLTPARQY